MNEWEKLKREAQRYKEMYPVGTRLVLESMDDPYAPVAPGTRGTVRLVDDMGTIHMNWDNGRTLGLVPGEDSFRVLSPKELAEENKSVVEVIAEATQSCEDVNNRGNEWYVRLISADICDFLEELLDKHDLTIPSNDREGEEGEARIYGEVYSDLEDNVTDMLASLCVTVKENPDIIINENEIDVLKPISGKNELHIRAVAVKICDLFEDLLDEHDITIPSEDREGTEDEARIFGDVYYGLEGDIEEVLVALCEEIKAAPDIVINVEDYNGFVEEGVQKQNGVDDILVDATARCIRQNNAKGDMEITKE